MCRWSDFLFKVIFQITLLNSFFLTLSSGEYFLVYFKIFFECRKKYYLCLNDET